jgi:hypothetical protein
VKFSESDEEAIDRLLEGGNAVVNKKVEADNVVAESAVVNQKKVKATTIVNSKKLDADAAKDFVKESDTEVEDIDDIIEQHKPLTSINKTRPKRAGRARQASRPATISTSDHVSSSDDNVDEVVKHVSSSDDNVDEVIDRKKSFAIPPPPVFEDESEDSEEVSESPPENIPPEEEPSLTEQSDEEEISTIGELQSPRVDNSFSALIPPPRDIDTSLDHSESAVED